MPNKAKGEFWCLVWLIKPSTTIFDFKIFHVTTWTMYVYILLYVYLDIFGCKIHNTNAHLSKSLGNTGLDIVGRSTEGFTTLGHETSSKVS